MTTTTRLTATPSFKTSIDAWVDDALRRPADFALLEADDRLFRTWSLGPVIEHRDSDLLQRSNAKALLKYLQSDPSLTGWEIKSCRHWAVGHVDHLTFCVIEKVGRGASKSTDLPYLIPSRPGYRLTRIARIVKQWFDDLEAYPVADESGLSEMEYEAGLEAIQSEADYACRHSELKLRGDLPDGWESEVYRLISDHMHPEGDGMFVPHEALFEALQKLQYLKPR